MQGWEYAHLLGELEVEFDADGVVTSCGGSPRLPVDLDATAAENGLSAADLALVEAALQSNAAVSLIAPDPEASSTLDVFNAKVEVLQQTVIGTADADLCLVRWPGDSRSSICAISDTYAQGSDISNIVAKAFLTVTPHRRRRHPERRRRPRRHRRRGHQLRHRLRAAALLQHPRHPGDDRPADHRRAGRCAVQHPRRRRLDRLLSLRLRPPLRRGRLRERRQPDLQRRDQRPPRGQLGGHQHDHHLHRGHKRTLSPRAATATTPSARSSPPGTTSTPTPSTPRASSTTSNRSAPSASCPRPSTARRSTSAATAATTPPPRPAPTTDPLRHPPL